MGCVVTKRKDGGWSEAVFDAVSWSKIKGGMTHTATRCLARRWGGFERDAGLGGYGEARLGVKGREIERLRRTIVNRKRIRTMEGKD